MNHFVLTGATGFLGSHLLQALLAEGNHVTVLKRSTSDTRRIKHLLEKIQTLNVDKEPLEGAFKAKKVDGVIHTACNYGRGGQATHEIVETNLLFGLRVLDAAVNAGVKAFFNTGTLLQRDLNPYSLSKSQFTDWLKQRSAEVQVVNLRLEHMYGPGDDQTKFVPWLINQLDQGVERIPLTSGEQLRDFTYIDDVVSAYLVTIAACDRLPSYSELDVGTGELVRVKDFVTALRQVYQSQNPASATTLGFGDIPLRDGEMMAVKVNNTSLKELGWAPGTSQNQGLSRIVKGIS